MLSRRLLVWAALAALLSGVSRTESGYVIFVVLRYLVCLAVMLPATFCAGMTLPLMTKLALADAILDDVARRLAPV